MLNRLLRVRSTDRSGQSEALAAHATGIPPALLDAAAAPLQSALPPGIVPADEVPTTPRGRRGRGLDRAEDVLGDQVAQKVLGFWLQNRHQVLFPLTVNFRTMGETQAALLASWSAAALLAVAPTDAEAAAASRRWLEAAGADAPALAHFDAGFEVPVSLGTLIATIAGAPGLTGTAYVAALVTLGQREPTARFFLEFVAARLALPATVVRSANRRFGR